MELIVRPEPAASWANWADATRAYRAADAETVHPAARMADDRAVKVSIVHRPSLAVAVAVVNADRLAGRD